jgi:hypothetical protein
MKNIHILPTTEPSRLYIFNKKLYLDNKFEKSKDKDCVNQHIYITSDKEIKEGDWYIDFVGGLRQCISKNMEHNLSSKVLNWDGKAKKIILTTDQELIKDGVQSIDDTFLEWFIKNPSCENVEVTQLCKIGCDKLILNGENSICCGDKKYKITIPQEEPKQETLEEASHTAWLNYEHVEGNLYSTSFKNGFKFGAEWQEKRMYSEEDLKKAFNFGYSNGFASDAIANHLIPKEKNRLFTEWFEQFKKK